MCSILLGVADHGSVALLLRETSAISSGKLAKRIRPRAHLAFRAAYSSSAAHSHLRKKSRTILRRVPSRSTIGKSRDDEQVLEFEAGEDGVTAEYGECPHLLAYARTTKSVPVSSEGPLRSALPQTNTRGPCTATSWA